MEVLLLLLGRRKRRRRDYNNSLPRISGSELKNMVSAGHGVVYISI
jgi:hypothetical protein